MKAWPSLLLLLGVALFHVALVQPLHERREQLHAQLARQQAASPPGVAAAAAKLDGFYRLVARTQTSTDWLATLHEIADASGVVLQTATYRPLPAAGRLERYEMTLPVAGSYAQIREFVARALAEIPVLSLDELALRRSAPADARVEADLRMTLHKGRR